MPKNITTFNDILAALEDKKEMILHSHLRHDVHFIDLKDTVLTLRLSPHSGADFIKPLKQFLDAYTGMVWNIIQSQEGGQKTHVEQKKDKDQELMREALQQNVVQSILKEFPNSKTSIYPRKPS
ncbi:MAG: hypothetical protein Q8K36_06650 [Alphaproteobacteria bacterium]|nr:hypothetical protein [Alphaproteobacteria bacterium]